MTTSMNLSTVLMRRLILISRVVGASVAILAFLVVVGWATGNYSLTRLIPDFGGSLPFAGQLHSAAALNLFFLGAGLLCYSFLDSKIGKKAAIILASPVIISSLLALYEAFSGTVLDSLRLWAPTPAAPGVTYPTPMIPEAAFTLLCLAVALVLIGRDSEKAVGPSQIAALLSIPVPILILFGAATRSPKLCALGGCFEMSLAFALLTLLLAVGIIFSRPDQGMARLLSSTSGGGRLCRRALVVLAFLPGLLILRTMAVNYRVGKEVLVEEPLSWALFGLILIGIVAYMVVSGARSLEVLETQKEEIVDKLLETEQALSNSYKVSVENSQAITGIRYKRICLICSQDFDESLTICPLDGGDLERVLDESLEGLLFAEKYQIDSLLGTGGMSSVYKAHHLDLKKDFAIKVLKNASGTEALKRFKREAQATSSLNHKNIVGVTDFGIAPDGRSYIVMEFVEGESLSELVRRMGSLTPKVSSYLITQICDGLIHAHEAGIVHRDLKPANIMLVKNKQDGITAKIVDFGLAKILDDGMDKSQQLTQTGECFGSPLYMSPEQCLGTTVDHRADIYALGCIAYECLTGAPPIIGTTILDTFNRHLKDPPPPFPPELNVPKEWAAIIFTALAKKAEHRPASVREFKEAFKKPLHSANVPK
ncbi:MAG: serine/threonine protein kinase [Candidatus Obscuribacterales bacterium]|nr:serine/threonine protein kinase [Candidatus Obscuribacterales bacterium]